MKTKLFFLLGVVVGISSCTKEASMEQEDNPPVTDTLTVNMDKPLLVRVVDYDEGYPEDSTITDYYYNVNNKLIRIRQHTVTAHMNSSYEDDEWLIYRNENDTIQRLTVMQSHYEGRILTRQDSSVYDLTYDPISKNCKYAIYNTFEFDYTGTPHFIRDSLVYTYNNNNDKIVLFQVWRKDPLNGLYFEAESGEYEYDAAGNMIIARNNENYENQGISVTEHTFRYDDKVNPFNFGMEGFLFGVNSYSIPTPHNPLYVDHSPDMYIYTYNSYDLPIVQSYKFLSSNGSLTRYFYYNK